MTKKPIILAVAFVLLVWGGYWLIANQETAKNFISPLSDQQKESKPKPLQKYSFENLKNRDYPGSEITLEKVIKEEEKYVSWLFSYLTDNKKVTGMLNLPLTPKSSPLPVVVMIRGYADDEIYFTGLGTRNAAAKFAENEFITLAPDFLGFGGSDSPSADILEARFYRPVTILNLIASIRNLPQADPEKIFLWGHSNGGQIALSVLEISKKNYPTALWAPVTEKFPDSVLRYMDEYEKLDELGKEVYDKISGFKNDYQASLFSIETFLTDIATPIQLQRGGIDSLVPQKWSDDFVDQMQQLGKEISYFVYPESDHNLKRDWDEVVERDLEFFKKYL
ncbi:alpha/beta fold hydrolase [Patescibacteria group bacterium]|nr:alpha/beta fold hydrolase [Patescibacteria group bacterium]